MRIGHVRDEADPGGEETRVVFGAGDRLGELGAERAAHRRDIDPDLLEHLAGHVAADSAATGLARCISPVPWGEREDRVGPRFALDRLEGCADTIAQAFEPVAGGLLLIVELDHRRLFAAAARRRKGAYDSVVMSA